jgi:uncharacterized protein (DUF1778 family)
MTSQTSTQIKELKQVNTRVTRETFDALDRAAKAEHRSAAAEVRRMLEARFGGAVAESEPERAAA